MPTYEYECKTCGHTFDAFQSMKDEPLKTCPECGKEIRRLINGGTGIIFKGGGFYVTDNHGKGSKSGGSAKTSGEKPGGANSSEKTGSQPSSPEAGAAKTEPLSKAAGS